MINKLEDAYKMVRQAVVEFVFHLAEAHAFKCDDILYIYKTVYNFVYCIVLQSSRYSKSLVCF